jgi:lipopolysaccharide transport system ATP-binding protein
MTEDTVISVRDITKTYKLYDSHLDRLKEAITPFRKSYHRDFNAVNGVSFDIKRGETVGIVGKNGSGKSTLLKIIAGILTPNSGDLNVAGKISALLELGAGFNAQMTGMENVYFNGTLLGYSREEMERKVDDILSFADIGGFIHQPVKTYSSGMFIRLAFAVATSVDPDILIVDEALAVGDELFQRKCFGRIREFSERGKTILFVTHSGPTIVELCNRALLFDRGELLVDGTPKLVVSLYHKLLYSKPENHERVRNEILKVDVTPEFKQLFNASGDEANDDEDAGQEPQSWHQELARQKPYFVESLISQSLIEYKNIDIEIADLQIRTLSDEKVNVLVMNQDYIYSYRLKFKEDVRNVFFGMCFKTKKGIELGWTEALKDSSIKTIMAGQEYLVEWHFKCTLLPGTYYTNASVKSYDGGKKTFLCRITDALAFQVQDIPWITYGGMVHFNQSATITKL